MTRFTIYRTLGFLAVIVATVAFVMTVEWDEPIELTISLWGGFLGSRLIFCDAKVPLRMHAFAALCATAAMCLCIWQGDRRLAGDRSVPPGRLRRRPCRRHALQRGSP